MSLRVVSFILLSVVVISSSCSKNITEHCPGYNDSFIYSWFPYDDTGENFYFVNDTGGRDTIHSSTVIWGVPYTVDYTKYAFEKKQEHCDVLAWISLDVSGPPDTTYGYKNYPYVMSRYMKLEHVLISSKGGGGFSIYFVGLNMSLVVQNSDITGLDHNTDTTTYQKFDTYQYHGKAYNDVSIITASGKALERAHVDKVLLARGYGIIGYRSYPEGLEYWLE